MALNIDKDHLSLILGKNLDLSLTISSEFLIFTLLLITVLFIFKFLPFRHRTYEIDEAQFGIGSHKVKIKPNDIDKQIAYKVWVELSTRKVGLEIDLDNDVITEVYDSWYSFFSVTRELIKDVPVSKFRRKDTERIIKLSIDVLNTGIRPHLTKWQARFRKWYEYQIAQDDNFSLTPQEIQQKFPDYEELKIDILTVNQNLIGYRGKMYELITGL